MTSLSLSGDIYLSYKLHMNVVRIQKKLHVKKSRDTMVFLRNITT